MSNSDFKKEQKRHPGHKAGSVSSRTVQGYIDEVPIWPDGTEVSSSPMTAMQWRIWGMATAGKFFEGLVVFMTGVALPLIVAEFGLSPAQKGVVGAAVLSGILVGASLLGGLSDRFGRKRMFIAEMIIFAVFLVGLTFSPSYICLVISLFGIGTALGCDYPTAHMVISESIPSNARGRLVLGAFGFQAVGALFGTAVGYLILYENPEIQAWRWMYATVIVPALLVIAGRFFITDSGQWLVSRGKIEEAEKETLRLLRRLPAYPTEIKLVDPDAIDSSSPSTKVKQGYKDLFKGENRRATILASLPWFLQDLGTYGIGIFTPTILATVIGAKTLHPHNLASLIHNDMLAARGAAFIDVLLIVGIIFAVLLTDKIGRIHLQVFGFIGCALGLILAALSSYFEGPAQILFIFAGFMLFNFMTNVGPNSQTYLLSGEVFPTKIRGKGAGFAASFAKLGAVMTAFLFPILLKDIGTTTLLYILVVTSLTGALLTWLFRIETKGVSLEKIGRIPVPHGAGTLNNNKR